MKPLVPRRQAGLQWFGHASVLSDSLQVTSPFIPFIGFIPGAFGVPVCLRWFRGPSSATAAGPLWQVGSDWI